MRGVRNGDCDWPPELGLHILNSEEVQAEIGGPPHTEETIAAFMGITRQRVNQEVIRTLRKLRVRLNERGLTWEVVQEVLSSNGSGHTSQKKFNHISPR